MTPILHTTTYPTIITIAADWVIPVATAFKCLKLILVSQEFPLWTWQDTIQSWKLIVLHV